MKGYQHLKKMIEEHRAEFGGRAASYLGKMHPPVTSDGLAFLAAAALKERGITYHLAGDWLENGRYLCQMEIQEAQKQDRCTDLQASELQRQVNTTFTPCKLLQLLCKLWAANQKHHRQHAMRLLKPEDRLALRPESTELERLTA